MVNVNLRRFSRSKVAVDEDNTNIINPEIDQEVAEVPKKRRGRPVRTKKSIEEIDTEPEVSEPEVQFNTPDDISEVSLDHNFLADLNADNFREPPSQQEIREQEKIFKEQEKQQKTQRKNYDKLFKDIQKQSRAVARPQKSKYEDDSSLFDDQGTELIGHEKRVLLSKIQQYKNLFPDELSKFKIKKNCSTTELQLYLNEMESIVSTSSVEQFLSDSIIQCIKLTEGISSYTKYDITGCADLLKANKQFHTLTKQMYIKYKVFDKVPPEYSLAILVATTAYVCKNKNAKKKEIENFLNTPIINNNSTTTNI
jgi:hypothetical protein